MTISKLIYLELKLAYHRIQLGQKYSSKNKENERLFTSGIATRRGEGQLPLDPENEKFKNFVLHESRTFVTYIADCSIGIAGGGIRMPDDAKCCTRCI